MDWRRYVEGLDLHDFVALELEGARVLVREDHREHAKVLAGLETPDVVGRSAGGRARHPIVALPGTGTMALVRRYRRGGLIRHVNRDLYIGGHRAFDELAVTERARRAGVEVPRVLAAAELPATLGYRALLATRWIDGVVELPEWLSRGREDRDAVLRRVGEQVRLMHDGGIDHPDLNLRNILVTGEAGVVLLDFDRAGIHRGSAPARVRERNLRRFARSARKLAVELDDRDWSALADGYGSGWPLTDRRG